eukprot:1027225-Prymnesium_polylepis.1
MEKFAERYCSLNEGVFANPDTAYVLAYSLIMLNTDAHSSQIKKKMTQQVRGRARNPHTRARTPAPTHAHAMPLTRAAPRVPVSPLQEFVNMNRGINDSGDLPTPFLEQLYQAITTNEIRIKEDMFPGQNKEP